MRDEEQRPVEGAERTLELLYRRQVEVVRRLVEHEATGPARSLERELGPSPLARREAPGPPQHMVRVQVELREQRACVALAKRRRTTG